MIVNISVCQRDERKKTRRANALKSMMLLLLLLLILMVIALVVIAVVAVMVLWQWHSSSSFYILITCLGVIVAMNENAAEPRSHRYIEPTAKINFQLINWIILCLPFKTF